MILSDEQLDDLRQKGIIDSDYSMGDAIETAEALRSILLEFRNFTIEHAAVWKPGASHHNPIWAKVAEAIAPESK